MIGLQAYFSYNDFQIKRVEFKQVIKTCFEEAVSLERGERKSYVLDSTRSFLLDTNMTKIYPQIDSQNMQVNYIVEEAHTGIKAVSMRFEKDNTSSDEPDEKSIEELLSFYMGKNTPQRQEFIIDNLKVELDTIEENNKL